MAGSAQDMMAIDNKQKGLSAETWSRADIAWMVFVLVIGLAVRLFRIDHQPFWLDEALTSKRVHLGFGDLIVDSFSNRHMPTYFMLLQLLTPFTSSDVWLRVPSALFGSLSAIMVFIITRRLGGRGAALFAGLLMALSPLQVQYGQEARSYTLVTLLITIALWGLVCLAQYPLRASLDVRRRESHRWAWAAYVFGSIAALDVLGDAAPWLLASNLSLFLIWRGLCRETSPAWRIGFRRNCIHSIVVILACTLPFYAAIMAAGDHHIIDKFDWIPKLSLKHLWVTASSVYLMRMTAVVRFAVVPTAVPVLGTFVGLLGCVGLYRIRHRLEGRVLILGFMLLPLLILVISMFKSVLLPRYILWSAAPFFVLVGLGASTIPRRVLPAAITLLFLLGAVNLGPVYRTETKPRWDMAAATLAANVRPGDTVFTSDPNAPTMLSVLKPKNTLPIESTAVVTSQLDEALARWKQGSRVWAVTGRSALGKREDLDAFKNRMAVLGTPTMEIPQGKEITILMFPAPPADTTAAAAAEPGS